MPRRKRKPAPIRHYTGVVIEVLTGRKVILDVHRKHITVKYVSGFSPIVGHTVRVEKHKGKWAATGPKSDGEVTIPAGDDAPDLPTSGTYGPLRPIYTGTWTGTRWRVGDLEQGSRAGLPVVGAAFYGTGPRVLLRGDSDECHLTVRGRSDLSVGTLSVWPVTERSRPFGAPTRLGVTPVATVAVAGTLPSTVDIPTPGNELASGTWGGFALYDAEVETNLVVGTELDSLTLTMDWSV